MSYQNIYQQTEEDGKITKKMNQGIRTMDDGEGETTKSQLDNKDSHAGRQTIMSIKNQKDPGRNQRREKQHQKQKQKVSGNQGDGKTEILKKEENIIPPEKKRTQKDTQEEDKTSQETHLALDQQTFGVAFVASRIMKHQTSAT